MSDPVTTVASTTCPTVLSVSSPLLEAGKPKQTDPSRAEFAMLNGSVTVEIGWMKGGFNLANRSLDWPLAAGDRRAEPRRCYLRHGCHPTL